MEYKIEEAKAHVVYRPLKSRFYILFTMSMFNFICGFFWNSWAPIILSLKQLYKWNITDINLQSNLFAIVFCVFFIPIVYIWNKKGIRIVYFASASLLVVGTAIRLYPGSIRVQSNLIQIGSVIIGLGAVISLIAPPVISMIWFPSGERARSTAIPISFNTLGTAIAPIIATHMVPTLDSKPANRNASTDAIENGINNFLYLQCCLAVVVIVMIIVYFPLKPHVPPCKSSDEELRVELVSGIKLLVKNKQFWIAFLVNMIVYGINSGVSSVSVTYVIPMGVSQKDAAFIAFLANVMSFISALAGGWLGDRYSYKKIIIATVGPTFVLYFLGGLQVIRIIPTNLYIIYIIGLSQGLFTNFGCPASFEMGVEAAFPVSEEVSNALLVFGTNLGSALFLSVCMIPNFGTSWIPFFYSFLSLFMLPLMWFYKDERKRQNCDAILHNGDVVEVNDNGNIQNISERVPLLG